MSQEPVQNRHEDPRWAALAAQYENSARGPVDTGVLEYGPTRPAGRVSGVGQYFMGVLFTVCYGALVAAILEPVPSSSPDFGLLVLGSVAVFFAVLMYVGLKLRWIAFFAGFMTVIFAVPVVLAVSCFVALSRI